MPDDEVSALQAAGVLQIVDPHRCFSIGKSSYLHDPHLQAMMLTWINGDGGANCMVTPAYRGFCSGSVHVALASDFQHCI